MATTVLMTVPTPTAEDWRHFRRLCAALEDALRRYLAADTHDREVGAEAFNARFLLGAWLRQHGFDTFEAAKMACPTELGIGEK